MSRWRIFAALVACLAALAVGTPAFAGVFAPSDQPAGTLAATGECKHCDECDAKPCMQLVDCTAPCAVSLPGLAAASAELQARALHGPMLPLDLGELTGERPPPDPFPPRT